jgi:hypothetical protein
MLYFSAVHICTVEGLPVLENDTEVKELTNFTAVLIQ